MKEKKYTFFESYHRALSRVSDARYGRVVRAMSNSSDNLLTVDEVSKKFKVNRITVWRWERDGLLHGKKMGRRKYYAAADIEKVIKEQ